MPASVGLVQPIDPTHDGEPYETDGLRALPEPCGSGGVQQSLFAHHQRAPRAELRRYPGPGRQPHGRRHPQQVSCCAGRQLNAPNSPPTDSGRREINWDGVPAALTNVDTFPATFFNVNSKRGVLMSTRGTGLRVDSSAFASINAGLADQFKAFSPKKLFVAVGSNQVEVDFKLAGTTTNGVVKGFGVVFSDVDKAAATRVEYFDANGVELASIASPAHLGAQGFTFVGAVFNSAIVARVLITSGEAALDATITDVSADGTKDLVVMDDFVYGEPQPLPQTSNYSRSL